MHAGYGQDVDLTLIISISLHTIPSSRGHGSLIKTDLRTHTSVPTITGLTYLAHVFQKSEMNINLSGLWGWATLLTCLSP